MTKPYKPSAILTPPLGPVPYTGKWPIPAVETETNEEVEETVEGEETQSEEIEAEETAEEDVTESSSAAARRNQSSAREIIIDELEQTTFFSKVCLFILQLIQFPIYLIFYKIPKRILYFFKFVISNFVVSLIQHVWYVKLLAFRQNIAPSEQAMRTIFYYCILVLISVISATLTVFVVCRYIFLAAGSDKSFAVFQHERHQHPKLVGYSYKMPSDINTKHTKTVGFSDKQQHNTQARPKLQKRDRMLNQIQLENEKIWDEIKRTWSEIHSIDDELLDQQTQIDSIKQTLKNSVFIHDNETGEINLPYQLHDLLQNGALLQEKLRNMQTMIEKFIIDTVRDYDLDVLNMTEMVDDLVKATIAKYEETMDQLVKTAVSNYHQDVLNTADFALKSRGGSIIYSLTSPTYFYQPAWVQGLKLFVGIPSVTNPPGTAISSQKNAGECWSMYGNEGTLGIMLSELIVIQAITVEFPSTEIMINKMGSAPKAIEVFGISNVYPRHPTNDSFVPLGSIQYDIRSNYTIQTFDIIGNTEPFRSVLVKIKSNWGNLDYTDICRIRIHGIPIS